MIKYIYIYLLTLGVTCTSLPPCPSGIDFRSQTEYVPGRNCKKTSEPSQTVQDLPPCPIGIEFRTKTEYVPGKNCRILPFCPDESDSSQEGRNNIHLSKRLIIPLCLFFPLGF